VGDFLNKLLYRLAGSSSVNKESLLERLISLKEADEKQFYTINKRPFYTDQFYYAPGAPADGRSIVIQGPLLTKNDFTFETLKLYSGLVKPSRIILSTWENEDHAAIRQIEDLGVTVIRNKQPEFNGNQNINLQIVSTLAGLAKAKESGANRVLKTRTDQRIYSTSALLLFDNLLTVFPVNVPAQKHRLIITSLGTIKYRLYGAGDMLMYGDIDDMLKYWSVDLDLRRLDIKQAGDYSIREFSQLRLGELYLCSKYFEKLGYTLDWTLKQSWELLARYFCVVDDPSVDLFWPKYDLRKEFRYKYYTEHPLQHMTFTDWLSLYLEKEDHYPEEILNRSFGED